MPWLALSFSLPSGSSSSKRVAVWRRLQKIGAVSPTGSLYLLPAGAESQEAFDWLAQEITEAGGEALVLPIDRLDPDSEGRLMEAFRTARDEDYRKIVSEAAEAERAGRDGLGDRLEKLRRRFAEIARIDFFGAPEKVAATAALARLEALLDPGEPSREAPAADLERYRGRRWVTRPRPHVDRLACAWLIRRFVDPQAEIRYADKAGEGELSFDMKGAHFGHRGGRCTFETMLAAFGLENDPALVALAAIVHEIDLPGGTATRPEAAGIDAVLRGWAAAGWTDAELERHGIALFEGLYRAFAVETESRLSFIK